MLPFIQLCKILSNFGFFLTIVINLFFIYLTVYKIKTIYGTYKTMITVFAVFGVVFAVLKIIAQPFAHNYNGAFVIFSANTWLLQKSHLVFEILQFTVALYTGFYTAIQAFLAVQFAYRLLTLKNISLAKKFSDLGILAWIWIPFLSASICTGLLYVLTYPDEFTDRYLREEFLKVYDLDLNEIPRFIMIVYNPDNTIRWKNLSFILAGFFILGIQYLIIIICGIQMHLAIKNELNNISAPNRKLQKQYFQALIVQTLVPTFLFVLPAIPLLLGPLLDLKWSMQTGFVISLLSIYPPIDSIAFMVIVHEYRRVINGVTGVLKLASNKISCVTV